MPSTINSLGFTTEVGKTTSRNISYIDAVAEQSFKVRIYGLNINTKLNMYSNNKKVSSNNIIMEGGGDFKTDFKGDVEFVYYYKEALSELTNVSETAYLDYLNRNSGSLTLVAVDSASINSNTLPVNYRDIARCYSECIINKTYDPQVTTNYYVEIKEVGNTSPTTNG
jgi:hypothetical protein